MRRLILILGVAGIALAGCGKPDPAHDVAFYRANADARQAEVAHCSTSGATATAPECLAAVKAAGEAESERALPYQAPASRLKNADHL
jgi:hypothetical protein